MATRTAPLGPRRRLQRRHARLWHRTRADLLDAGRPAAPVCQGPLQDRACGRSTGIYPAVLLSCSARACRLCSHRHLLGASTVYLWGGAGADLLVPQSPGASTGRTSWHRRFGRRSLHQRACSSPRSASRGPQPPRLPRSSPGCVAGDRSIPPRSCRGRRRSAWPATCAHRARRQSSASAAGRRRRAEVPVSRCRGRRVQVMHPWVHNSPPLRTHPLYSS